MEQEALEYLNRHKVIDLLNHVTESLVYAQPPRVGPFMTKMLMTMKDTRDNTETNDLINHPNIKQQNSRALFRMMDPMGRGKICVSQMQDVLDIYDLDKLEDSKLYQAFQKGGEIEEEEFIAYLHFDLQRQSCYYEKKDPIATPEDNDD